jgi:predicted RNA-binding Zn-ribbon protein involved in translation (DUF1610 family)
MFVCPTCGKKVQDERLLSLSRIDNESYVCNECGINEALDSYPNGDGWVKR